MTLNKLLNFPKLSYHIYNMAIKIVDFPAGSNSKESAYNAGDPGLIPVLGRSPAKGNSYPLQYSCLKNSTDRGAW